MNQLASLVVDISTAQLLNQREVGHHNRRKAGSKAHSSEPRREIAKHVAHARWVAFWAHRELNRLNSFTFILTNANEEI